MQNSAFSIKEATGTSSFALVIKDVRLVSQNGQ